MAVVWRTLLVFIVVCALPAAGPALADAATSDFAQGKPVQGPVKTECDSPVLLDGILKLCQLFGGGCDEPKSQCQTYARQLFTGTAIKPGTQGSGNGMGGSGELVADALLCTMRELSPQLRGPLRVSAPSIDLGIGDLVATQEIGFVEWRRVNPMFRGYRKIVLKLPVVGKTDGLAQGFKLTRVKYTRSGTNPFAGNREIVSSHALIIDTEDRTKKIVIRPKGFPVTTPVGVFTVSPSFDYSTRAQIVDGGFKTADVDIPNFLGGANTVRYTDIFGLNAGLARTTIPDATMSVSTGAGWISHIALGSRAPLTGAKIWAPAGVLHNRPDLDFSKPRSSVEADPSINVLAKATVRYPDNPLDFLPDWIDAIPFLSKNSIVAFVEVSPTIEAGAAGHLYLGAAEGRGHTYPQEFKIAYSRFSNSALMTGLSVAGSFRIEVRLALKVKADFPWPVGETTFIDLDKTIPIPLTGDKRETKPEAVGGWSSDFQAPETLDHLRTLYANHAGSAAGAALKTCYAAENQPNAQPAPQTPPEPGNPKDLFKNMLWPCDICVFTKAVKHDGRNDPAWSHKLVDLPARGEYVMRSTGTPNWKCSAPAKSGCMNMCRMNPDRSLVIQRTPAQIAGGLAHGSAERAFYEACIFETAIARPRAN